MRLSNLFSFQIPSLNSRSSKSTSVIHSTHVEYPLIEAWGTERGAIFFSKQTLIRYKLLTILNQNKISWRKCQSPSILRPPQDTGRERSFFNFVVLVLNKSYSKLVAQYFIFSIYETCFLVMKIHHAFEGRQAWMSVLLLWEPEPINT